MAQQFGKGLESLIPKKKITQTIPDLESKKGAVFLIEIDRIKPNPYQPRREFDQEGLNALADSIRNHGILQPLIVSRIENPETGQAEYQLIAGERRLLAAKMANFSRVPVIIKESTNRQKLELSLIENVQRADLNPIEKAIAFKRLQEEFGFSQNDIARLIGKSREAVANTLRLLSLPEEIRLATMEGKISEGHARAIMMAKIPEKQKIVFAKVLHDGLSVHQTESLVQKLDVWQPKKRTILLMEEWRDLIEKMKKNLGVQQLKVKIESGRPQLTIVFTSKKEIENWIEKIIFRA